jgi:methylmalonyl-CoA/ethylmalonyl-CoA epimerase
MKLDHVGIAVSSIKDAAAFYKKSLGLEIVSQEEVISQKVKVAFLKTGESFLELLEATGPDSVIASFIKKRGPGLHHLAFEVSGIEGEMERLRKENLNPLEPSPRIGARGHKVCFLHPRNTLGTLIELVEPHG